MTIFAITNNTTSNSLRDAQLFATQEGARTALQKIAADRKYKMGVDVQTDTPDKFAFTLGWEEHYVVFSIIELEVQE